MKIWLVPKRQNIKMRRIKFSHPHLFVIFNSILIRDVFFQSYWYRSRHNLLVCSLAAQVGHDLTALLSCVGVWQNDRVEIIANDQGNRTTPSYVSFSENERLIGDAAKNQVAMNPHNTYVIFLMVFTIISNDVYLVFLTPSVSLAASLTTQRCNRT